MTLRIPWRCCFGKRRPPTRPPPGLLFATPYSELHRLARREAGRYGRGAVLGTTTLLHEAYLEMSQREGLVFPDRARFLSYAGRAMRRLVIDR